MVTEEKYYENRFCIPFCRPSAKKALLLHKQVEKVDSCSASKTTNNEDVETPSLNSELTKKSVDKKGNDDNFTSHIVQMDEVTDKEVNSHDIQSSENPVIVESSSDIFDQHQNNLELIKLSQENQIKDDIDVTHTESLVIQHVIEDVLELNNLVNLSHVAPEEDNDIAKPEDLKEADEPISPSTAVDECLYDGFPDSAGSAENRNSKSEENQLLAALAEIEQDEEIATAIRDALKEDASNSNVVTPRGYSMFKCCVRPSQDQESLVY